MTKSLYENEEKFVDKEFLKTKFADELFMFPICRSRGQRRTGVSVLEIVERSTMSQQNAFTMDVHSL